MYFTILPAFAFDDSLKTRVTIAPFFNESGDSTITLLGQTVTDTISLSLKLLGSYRIEEPEGLEAVRYLDSAKPLAEYNKLDSIVVEAVSQDHDGSYLFTLRLLDRQRGQCTITQTAKAGSILDVFDTTDDLVKGFLEAIFGTHIGSGAIMLENSGEKGEYELSIDGSSVGKDLATLSKFLYGRCPSRDRTLCARNLSALTLSLLSPPAEAHPRQDREDQGEGVTHNRDRESQPGGNSPRVRYKLCLRRPGPRAREDALMGLFSPNFLYSAFMPGRRVTDPIVFLHHGMECSTISIPGRIQGEKASL